MSLINMALALVVAGAFWMLIVLAILYAFGEREAEAHHIQTEVER